MKVEPNARYSKEHEWVRKERDLFVYGITDYAQDQLSERVYVELSNVGESFSAGDIICVVESVKAAADLYSPIAGEIVEIHESLIDTNELLNSDPYKEGWIVKFKVADPADWDNLLSPRDYENLLEEQ